MSPFQDQNGLQRAAEIKMEQKAQYPLGGVLTIIKAHLLTGEDARHLLTWLGFPFAQGGIRLFL